MKTKTLANEIDIAIVGAGTQALTLITHLLHKRLNLRRKVLAFDPSGRWLQQWQHQFASQEIPHLRSPAVHHPHPHPYALRRFAENRPHELFYSYALPGTRLFEDFCLQIIQNYQLKDLVYPASVQHILPFSRRFQLILGNGLSIATRRVVLATGGGKPYFPDWVKQIQPSYPADRLVHSSHIDLRSLKLTGERILIIGGGLTSGHLALGAVKRGARVDLMLRRGLQEKLFDADPGWLATGTELSLENSPLLADILENYPTQSVNGLPIVDPYLRIPRTECFIMGGLGALRLGPTARNISGGIKASQLIVEALIKPSLAVR